MIFKNEELIPVGNFLKNLTLPAQVSRGRTKLLTAIQNSVNDLASSERELVSEFGGVADDKGKVTWENGVPVEYHKEHNVLLKEEVNIDINQPTLIKALKDFFINWNEEIKPEDADVFDVLYDALEQQTEEK